MADPPSSTDGAAHRFPVSIKAVIVRAGRVVLLRNERREWELPGGKLEPGEDPAQCLRREVDEELGLGVLPTRLIDLWPYRIAPGVEVLVATYACTETDPSRAPTLSGEHDRLDWFDLDAVDALPMPAGYKRAIHAAGRDPLPSPPPPGAGE